MEFINKNHKPLPYIINSNDSSTSDQHKTSFVIVVIVQLVGIDEGKVKGPWFTIGDEFICNEKPPLSKHFNRPFV